MTGTQDTQGRMQVNRYSLSLSNGVKLLAAHRCQTHPFTSALVVSLVAETSLRRPATTPASNTLTVSSRDWETPRPGFTTLKVTMYLQAPPGVQQQLCELHAKRSAYDTSTA